MASGEQYELPSVAGLHPAQRMSVDLRAVVDTGALSSASAQQAPQGASSKQAEQDDVGVLRYSSLPTTMKGLVAVHDPASLELLMLASHGSANTGLAAKLKKNAHKNSPYFLLLNHSQLFLFENEIRVGGPISAPLMTLDMLDTEVDVGGSPLEILLRIESNAQAKAGSSSAASHGPSNHIQTSQKRLFRFLTPNQESMERWFYCLKRSRNSVHEFYELGKVIGQGAFGKVLIARDRVTGELCVVKQMVKNSSSRRQLALLQREMSILKRIDCRYVVMAYDIFHSETQVSIVMELMRGGELYDLFAEHRVFSEEIACHITNQLLEGLYYLHARGIVHRDIKPENILLLDSNPLPTVKLTDFGLSNMLESGLMTENLLNSVVGSLLYVAPELLAGKGYDYSVDIWAVGVILYALLSGQLPFNIHDKANYERFLFYGPSFTQEVWKSVSNVAKWFVRAMLQVSPSRRLSALGALQHPWIKANPYSSIIARSLPPGVRFLPQTPALLRFRGGVYAIIFLRSIALGSAPKGGEDWHPDSDLMKQWVEKVSYTLSATIQR
ncbi:Calcium/calmodulin-dependent protein kinase type 1D [Porphyridium purpureum]|uniref:Calcium/calmodulin-dependent protein kinase type 1D n=1 Tax=Porphyridium purpureum TaxID=35688 RepID=A0A5J4Z8B3_PORPP|nr:Calcium/calmodulin-dependent protein kinase type 1D [Porphyridium purpureum]|eukprot:POR9105..scf295_1